MPDDCPALKAANESRRRAWREMQRMRRLLALLTEGLAPGPKPPNFEVEGSLQRKALADAFITLLNQLARLEEAVVGVRPFLANPSGTSAFPNALINLNRSTNRPRVTVDAIRKLLGEIEAEANAARPNGNDAASGRGVRRN